MKESTIIRTTTTTDFGIKIRVEVKIKIVSGRREMDTRMIKVGCTSYLVATK